MLRHLILALVVSLAALLPAYGAQSSGDSGPASEAKGSPVAHAVADAGAAPSHGGGGHEAAGDPNILEPQPSLAIWTVVVFVGLLFVLGRFAWKPLLEALHQREVHLEHVLHDTERARNEAEALLAEHRRMMAEAQDKIRQMLDEARREAQAVADEVNRKAQADADSTRQRAERDIVTARDQALMELWSKAADLAVSVAGRVLARDIGPDEHRRLIETAMNELPAAGAAGNGHSSTAMHGGSPA